MSNMSDDHRVRQQLLEENRRLAQRCLELESVSRRQLEKLRTASTMLGAGEVDLRALLNSAAVGFALIDTGHRITGVNQALADFLRIAPEDLMGANFGNFVHVGKLPDFNRIVNPQSHNDGRGSQKREDIIELVSRDGSLTPCRVVVNDLLDENGAAKGYFLLVFDSGPELQAAKRLRDVETTLKETERSRTLFLEIVSRELRTPASSVVGMSRMLLEAGLDDRQAELAGVIHTSAGNLVKLVDDLVDAASPDPADARARPEPVSPSGIARSVANLFSVRTEEKGLSLRVNTAQNVPPRVMADPHILRRILTQLVDNSVKFTNRGHVTISIDVIGANLRFMVSDTGPGMDSTGRSSMLRPGHTRDTAVIGHTRDTAVIRRKGGIGVGLTLCRRLAAMLGGRLDYESEPGRGAEFHFSFPLIPAHGGSDTGVIEPPPEAVHLPPLTILLADANPMSSQIIQAYLNFDGHHLTHTDNGLDAAEKCRSNRYDLVILDRNLPKLDGMESLRLIREDERERGLRKAPILMMVPEAQMRQADHYSQAGANGVVRKPIRPVELMASVADATGVEPVAVAMPRMHTDYAAGSGGGSIRRLDGSQLANLSQAMPTEQFKGMLRFFMEDAIPSVLELNGRAQAVNPDRQRIAFSASKARGMAAYLGFSALAELLKRLENACRTGAPNEEIRELAGELSDVTDDSLEELHRVLPEAFATISDMRGAIER